MGIRVRERAARVRRWLRNSCTRNVANSYNREPARPSAGGRTVTDDYDFRASERRRARELDELEARRLRARERQRAQLRAAHRRRRLTVLAVLGLVIGVASGAWVWTSGTPKVRRPVVPAKALTTAKPVVRTMPAFTRGPHVGAAWSSTPGNLDRVLATPGINLIQLDVKDENGEVAGLGTLTPALAKRFGAEHEYYDLAHVTRLAHDRDIWVVARIVSFKDPIMAEANPSLAIHDPNGGVWHDGGGKAVAQPVQPRRLALPDQPGQGSRARGRRRGPVRLRALPERGQPLRHALPAQGRGAHERDHPALPRGGAQGAQAVPRQARRRPLRSRRRPRSRHRPGRRADRQARRRDLAHALPQPLRPGRARHLHPQERSRRRPSRSRWASSAPS